MLIPQITEPILITDSLIRLVVRYPDKILPGYLSCLINHSLLARRFLATRTVGTLMRIISSREILQMVLPLPPLAEQKEIADLYALMKKENRLMQQVQDRRQWLYRRILRRFLAFESRDYTRF